LKLQNRETARLALEAANARDWGRGLWQPRGALLFQVYFFMEIGQGGFEWFERQARNMRHRFRGGYFPCPVFPVARGLLSGPVSFIMR
jgi:hypothetical protein